MKYVSAIGVEMKASSLIRLIKNHSKILKLLQFEIFQLIKPDFEKVSIEYMIFLIMKQKQCFKILEISVSAILFLAVTKPPVMLFVFPLAAFVLFRDLSHNQC